MRLVQALQGETMTCTEDSPQTGSTAVNSIDDRSADKPADAR
jgi:hypothetical protein